MGTFMLMQLLLRHICTLPNDHVTGRKWSWNETMLARSLHFSETSWACRHCQHVYLEEKWERVTESVNKRSNVLVLLLDITSHLQNSLRKYKFVTKISLMKSRFCILWWHNVCTSACYVCVCVLRVCVSCVWFVPLYSIVAVYVSQKKRRRNYYRHPLI